MTEADMHNVMFRHVFSRAREDVADATLDASLWLTEESNGYAIFLRQSRTWFLLCYFPLAQRDRAVTTAVDFTKREPDDLRHIAVTEIYPNLHC